MNGRLASEFPALHMRYDPEAGAMYLRLRPGEVAETVEVGEMVDVDVEFVVADDFLPFLERHGGEFLLPPTMATAARTSAP